MKKFGLAAVILSLVLSTAVIKNTTKQIEDELFTVKENIRVLKSEFENPEASRYIGVADWAVSKEDAKKLWNYSEKTLEQWL